MFPRPRSRSRFGVRCLKPVVVGYGFGVAPIPADRLAILRKAFDAMLKDPEFLAEAAKSNLIIEPMSGAELDKVVR